MKAKLQRLPTLSHPLSVIMRIINALRQKRRIAFLVTTCFILLGFSSSYGQGCFPLTSGGTIGNEEEHCGPFDPAEIVNITYPSGGTGDIEYSWLYNYENTLNYGNNGWVTIPGATNANYNPGPITQTTYYLRCARRHGCTVYNGESNNVYKEVLEVTPTTITSSLGATFCSAGGTIGTTLTATTGLSYAWSTGATTQSINVSTSGQYSVTVTNGECSSSASINITATECCPLTNGGTIGYEEEHCGPFDPAEIVNITYPSGGTGDIEYSWLYNYENTVNYGNNGWVTIPGATNANYNPGPITQTTYYLRCARRHGCTVYNGESNNVYKEVLEVTPTTITSSLEPTFCSAGGTISNTLTASSGSSYGWSTGATTQSIDVSVSGEYSVTVTNGECSSSASISITATECCPLTDGGTIGYNESHCGSYESQEIVNITSPSGGTGDIEYVWLWNTVDVPNYGNNGWVVIPGATDSNYSPGVITTTTYYVRCARRHGCTTFIDGESNNVGKIVFVHPEASCSSENGDCNNDFLGTANVSVNGGLQPYSYTWSNGGNTASIDHLGAGTYSVSVSDSNGCAAVCTTSVDVASAILISETHLNVSIQGGNDGSIDITIGGGTSPYSYLWNDGDTTEDRSGLSLGSYSVTVTDDHGCSASISINITQPECTCSAPTNLTVDSISVTQANFCWNTVPCATSYIVKWMTQGKRNIWLYRNVTAPNTCSIFTNRYPDVYLIYVASVCSNGDTSDYSTLYTFQTYPSCLPPTNLYSDNITSSKATLHWTPGNDDASQAIWYRKVGVTAFTKKKVSATASSLVLTNLQAASGYQWKVRSKCGSSPHAVNGQFTSLHTFTTNPLKLADEQVNDMRVTAVNVYPNPTARDFTIDMQFSNVAIDACTIEVRNLVGQVIRSEKVAVVGGHLFHEVSFKELMPDGLYLISVVAGGSLFNEQLVINND
jgi:uncharacterized membrane protein